MLQLVALRVRSASSCELRVAEARAPRKCRSVFQSKLYTSTEFNSATLVFCDVSIEKGSGIDIAVFVPKTCIAAAAWSTW